ncbi:GNAT family N-acetyltransferase [Myroides odoratimimus]|uniref:GNAT family N-acetyltransferase n=1 Tax=Myroides odoratimimus TaxID=76832 RepID=UPI003D2F89C1
MLNIDLTIFPTIETERLYLRHTEPNDIDTVFSLLSNSEVMKYIPAPLAQTTEEAKQYISSLDKRMEDKECISWAIELKEEKIMIGTIGLYRMKLEHHRTEVGYMSLPDFNGRGYITEALKAVIEYAFHSLQFHSLEAVIDPNNIGLQKVLEKCGFEKEAHFKENWFFNGLFLDSLVYSKLNK